MDKKTAAMEAYAKICQALDDEGVKYGKEPEKLYVHFGMNDDDREVEYFILVDEDHQLIRVISPLRFTVKEEKRIDFAVATCAANHGMSLGNFDYDIGSGEIVYRMYHTFLGSLIGMDAITYMLGYTYAAIDYHHDNLLALNEGKMDIQEYLHKVCG